MRTTRARDLLPVLVVSLTNLCCHLVETTLICKTFSLSCIQSLQPLPPIVYSPQQPHQQPQHLDQVVWFEADDGAEAHDDGFDEDDDDQVDDYTAIEGLASHQDISELVWMEDDSQTEDEVHFDEHRLVLTSSSWPSSGVSTIVDALRPADSSSSSGPTTTGESSPAESSLMASSPAERSGSWMSTSSAEQSTISSTTST